MLQVQKKVPVDVLRPQGHIPPSLLHKEKKGELDPEDEELEPGEGPIGVFGRVW